MAHHNFSDVQALNRHTKIIAGRLEDDDTVNAGLGWTGANTGTGIYTITLDQPYPYLISFTATVQSTSGTDNYQLTIASHDVSAATPTIVVHVSVDDGLGAGVLTDLGDTDEIHFIAVLQNSSLPVV